MKTRMILATALIFALSACTAGGIAHIDAVRTGIVEPKVDRTIDAAISTFCGLPVRTQLRAIERKAITSAALVTLCPEWKALRDTMIGSAMDRLGVTP